MTNQRTGAFIAALRKEHSMTQEQLAEQLGVSNRSVSRWENGNTLPDYSLMQTLASVLGVSLSELLAGRRMEEADRTEDCVQIALMLAQREQEELRHKINRLFGIGLLFLLFGSLFYSLAEEPFVFFLLCTALGAGFFAAGFWTNNRKSNTGKVQLSVLTTGESFLRMKTAPEMLQFSKKYQSGQKKQHQRAFEKLAAALAADEYAVFTFIADSYTVDHDPGPWHVGAALTNKRFLICGEAVRGRFMTAVDTESYDRRSLKALCLENGRLVLQWRHAVIKMDGNNMASVAEKLQNLCFP